MQYKNTTDKNGIIERAEMLCGLGDGAISGDTTLLKQFTGLMNQAYFEVVMAIMSVDKRWKFDDYNYNDLNNAPITMVTSQADYSIPVAVTSANIATFLRLNGVYFQEATGERTYLTPMTEEDTLTTTDGTPTKYKNNGKSIIFQCPLSASCVTKYTTFHIEFQRVPDAFLYTDTTQQPGFIETYHDLIPLKGSALYLMSINPNLSQRYDGQFYTRLELLKRDIANLDDSTPRRLTPAYESNE